MQSSTTTSYKAGTAESTMEFAGLENNFDRSAAIKSFYEKNKRNLMLGAGVLVLVVFVFAIFNSKQQQASGSTKTCALLSERPATSNELPSLISSDDRKSLAQFKGYLEFFHRDLDKIKNREKYQPLRLSSIDWTEKYVYQEHFSCVNRGHYEPAELKRESIPIKTRVLRLMTDCAVVEFGFNQKNTTWDKSSASIVFNVDPNGSGESGRLLGSCSIASDANQLDFAAHHHYQCRQNMSLDCNISDGFHRKDPIYIRLWIEDLEFELNGNADDIKDLRFSKPVSVCSLPVEIGESRR